MLSSESQEYRKLLTSYSHAIEINPNTANYESRGILKSCQFDGNYGGLEDLNKAILIEPENASAYVVRGLMKKELLDDFCGGIEDLQQAAKLYKQQDNIKDYQIVIDLIEN